MQQGVQVDVSMLLQIIGELFVENYARRRGLIDGGESVQTSPRGVRESDPTSPSNSEVPYESVFPKIPRQDGKR